MSGARKSKDRTATIMLWLVMALTCGMLALILAFLVSKGWSVLSWEFLTKKPRSMMTAGGISTPIVGTLQLVLVSMGFAFPVGVFTAVYLVEYARDDWFTRALRLAVRSLAGVPSVVFGLFGLSFFVIFMGFDPSLLSAGLTLGCLALPVIVGASESALLAVPRDYRDASYALGATQWQTIRKVVLPAAFPSIITGAILSVGRVAGETAPIIFTGAAFFAPRFAKSIFDQVMALPYHVLILATAGTNIEKTRPIQYGTVLVLLFFVLGMTMTGVLWRARLRIRQRAQR
ncbi:MAG TPA: phosphate ABC transporter permease PstA [Thermovirgaceae bacterium]|jgi:phosphate transport system permease protein|nr:phosphate ABC transporter permease PstA [Synergistales bacterium]MDD5515794.1 phosphate ABC transporter permease PstA [Synergistales bacterium]NLV65917.1 phosphate ABC transporter permease PstA [Synergistaceae bacterium]HPJ48382.1 phosphate ABC transporter permease PstA [Synergistales bacterium]HRW88261.1 phosphate ABC transporter permease PstA [Thermovirgaceae bacterium]